MAATDARFNLAEDGFRGEEKMTTHSCNLTMYTNNSALISQNISSLGFRRFIA